MSDRNTEDIIGALYDMVQDARSMPLAADKCILERDRILDMLDEIIAQLPGELKQSRTIVESRNELISQARREAETILRQAHEQAKEMLSKEAIYVEAKRRAEELVAQTQDHLSLTASLADQFIAGFHNGTGLLQFAGQLCNDLIQHIQNAVTLQNALVGSQRHCSGILHHVVQRANDIFGSTVAHFLFPP